MINCIFLLDNSILESTLKEDLKNIFLAKDINSYNFISTNKHIFNTSMISFDGISILFFFIEIDTNILKSIKEERPDVYLISFCNKKIVDYFYEYHLFKLLNISNYLSELEDAINLLVDMNENFPNSKITFISNKNIICLDVNQIDYLKYKERKLYLFTNNESYQINGILKNYMFLKDKFKFVLYKRYLLINPNKKINLKHNKIYIK